MRKFISRSPSTRLAVSEEQDSNKVSPARERWEQFLRECYLEVIQPSLGRGVKRPKCFVSYCWGPAGIARENLHHRLKQFKHDLELIGAIVLLDVQGLENSIEEFMKKISECDYIFLIGTPHLRKRLEEAGPNNLKTEFELIVKQLEINPNCLCPLIFQGDGEFASALDETLLFKYRDEAYPFIFSRNILVRDCRCFGDENISPEELKTYIDTISGDGSENNGALGIASVIYKMVENQLLPQYSLLRKKLMLDLNRVYQDVLEADELVLLESSLRTYYQSTAECMVRLDDGGEVRVDELFVNLAIVEEETQRLYEQRELEQENLKLGPPIQEGKERSTKLRHGMVSLGLFSAPRDADRKLKMVHDSESIYLQKTNIKPEDIFSERTLKNDKRITPKELVLLGKAGIGKTTLCRYLAYSWASHRIWSTNESRCKFRWIFYLRLKEVANLERIAKEDKIHEILYETLWHRAVRSIPDLKAKSETIWNLLCVQPGKILFILDGYDEVAELRSRPCEALMNVRQFYNDQIHVLTTSRPHAQISKHADAVLENIGFVDEDIPIYIERYFQRDTTLEPAEKIKSTASLKKFLDFRPKIFAICRVPINMELLCSIWSDHQNSLEKNDLVMSDLYQLMLVKLLHRYLLRIGVTFKAKIDANRQIMGHPHTVNALKFLEELALEGFKTGNLILTYTIYEKLKAKYHEEFTNAVDDFINSGFLKAVGDLSADKLQKESYFIHLSFQEYLTARYYAKQFVLRGEVSKEDAAFIQYQKYNPRYLSVWSYVAGIIRTLKDELSFESEDEARRMMERGLRSYFKTLLSGPRDLYGMYEMELLTRCGEEAKWYDSPAVTDLLEFLGAWVMGISGLQEGQDREQLLHHLNQLFLICPFAMQNIRFRGRKSLFNFLTYEAKTPQWVSKFTQVSGFFLDLANDNHILKLIGNCLFYPCRSLGLSPVDFQSSWEDLANFTGIFGLCDRCCCFCSDDWRDFFDSLAILLLRGLRGFLLSPFVVFFFVFTVILVLTPALFYLVITGIITVPVVYYYLIPKYDQRRTATAAFLRLFHFEDVQIVKRLMHLILSTSDNETKLRLIGAFEPNNFSPRLHQYMITTLTKLIYSSDMDVQHAAWRRLIQFQISNNDFQSVVFQEAGFYLLNSTMFHTFIDVNSRRFFSQKAVNCFPMIEQVFSGFGTLRMVDERTVVNAEDVEMSEIVIARDNYTTTEVKVYWKSLDGMLLSAKDTLGESIRSVINTQTFSHDLGIILQIADKVGCSPISSEVRACIKGCLDLFPLVGSMLKPGVLLKVLSGFDSREEEETWKHHFIIIMSLALRHTGLMLHDNFVKVVNWQIETSPAERRDLYRLKSGDSFITNRHQVVPKLRKVGAGPVSTKETVANQKRQSSEVIERVETAISVFRYSTNPIKVEFQAKTLPIKKLFALFQMSEMETLADIDDFIRKIGVFNIFEAKDLEFLKKNLYLIREISLSNFKNLVPKLFWLTSRQKKEYSVLKISSEDDLSSVKSRLITDVQSCLVDRLVTASLSCSYRFSLRKNFFSLFPFVAILYLPVLVYCAFYFGYDSILFIALSGGILLCELIYFFFIPRPGLGGEKERSLQPLVSSLAGLIFLFGFLLIFLSCAALGFAVVIATGTEQQDWDWLTSPLNSMGGWIEKGVTAYYADPIVHYLNAMDAIRDHLSQECYFDALLRAYPSRWKGWIFNDRGALPNILRKVFSQHHTAIWQRSDGSFAWYKGRLLMEFKCRHPERLKRDIRSIRLFSNDFNISWISTINFLSPNVTDNSDGDEEESDAETSENLMLKEFSKTLKPLDRILRLSLFQEHIRIGDIESGQNPMVPSNSDVDSFSIDRL
jgi:hypothetical protein